MEGQRETGGIAVFVLKILARELILPPTSLLLLTFIAAWLIRRQRRFGWPLFVVGLGSLWLLCTPIVADRLAQWAERYPALDPTKPVDAQAVVVLGGGEHRAYAPEYRGPMADSILLERLTLAAYLARTYSLPLAVSGEKSEIVAMTQTLTRNFGLAPRWIEGNSRDTFENAQVSAEILFPAGVEKIILVTSSTHEWRAAQEFAAAGFNVLPAPAGVWSAREHGIFELLPSAGALQRAHSAVYELIGEPTRRLLSASGVRAARSRR